MATGAAHMVFQFAFDGSIAANDTDIQWRPYHRNCGCGLHKLKGSSKPHVCSQPRNVAFPQKEWQSDCSLSMAASRFSISSSRWSLPGMKAEENEMFDTAAVEGTAG